MKVAVLQYDTRWEDKDYNKNRIISLLDRTDLNGVDWIIFPEMTITGFSMDTEKTKLDAEDLSFFSGLCKNRKCCVSFDGVVDKQNKLITMDKNGKILNEYSKIHLFTYDDEHLHYMPGKAEQKFSIGDIRVVPTICYDLRFSYLYWNNALDTDVFVVAANWPGSRREHWLTLLKARAIENQCYVIGVNRLGKSPKNDYSGDSMVLDPLGKELLNCGSKEGAFVAELSKGHLAKVRGDFPVLKDRIAKKS